MAAIPIATVDNDGTDPGLRAAAAADTIDPRGGNVKLWVENGSGVSVTATLATYGNIYGQPIPDVPLVVPAGGRRCILVEPAWSDPTTGLVAVSYSATTTVNVAGLRG